MTILLCVCINLKMGDWQGFQGGKFAPATNRAREFDDKWLPRCLLDERLDQQFGLTPILLLGKTVGTNNSAPKRLGRIEHETVDFCFEFLFFSKRGGCLLPPERLFIVA